MSAAKPTRFGRGTAILSLMGTGGLAFFAVTRPWWNASVVTAGMPKTDVSVTGSSVAPLAVGAALLIVAAALGIREQIVTATDPYESDLGRARADQTVPKRVRG